jgi:predicted transcriptional regulator
MVIGVDVILFGEIEVCMDILNSKSTCSSIMTHDVKTETEDHNIMAACKVMNDINIGCVVIVKIQNNLPVGKLPKGIWVN